MVEFLKYFFHDNLYVLLALIMLIRLVTPMVKIALCAASVLEQISGTEIEPYITLL